MKTKTKNNWKKRTAIKADKVSKTTVSKIKALPFKVDLERTGCLVSHYVADKELALAMLCTSKVTMIQDGKDGDGKEYISPDVKSFARSITVTEKGLARIEAGKTDKASERLATVEARLFPTAPLKRAWKARWRAIGNERNKHAAAVAKRQRGMLERTSGGGMAWHGKTELTNS